MNHDYPLLSIKNHPPHEKWGPWDLSPSRPGDLYAVPKDRFVARRLAADAAARPLARRIKAAARRWAMPREEGYPSLGESNDVG